MSRHHAGPSSQQTYSLLYLVPFLITTVMVSVRLIQPDLGGDAAADGSLANQLGYGSAYVLALVLLVRNRFFWIAVLRNSTLYLCLMGMVLLSALWSYFPEKVVVSFAHQVGIAAVAICTVIYINNDPISFFRNVQRYILLYMVVTVAVTVLIPDVGLMEFQPWESREADRWRGLTSHPNSLGQICAVGVWVSMSLWLLGGKISRWSTMILVNLVVVLFVLVMTNSVTSILVTLFILVNSVYFRRKPRARPGGRALKHFFVLFALATVLVSLFAGSESVDGLLSLLGRDTTLTGRLDMWQVGLAGVAEKPVLGWGYDGLRSFARFAPGFDYTQLHNGYLDLLARGGTVSLVLMLALILHVLLATVKRGRHLHPNIVVSLTTFIWAVLIMNFAEASLVKNTSLVWLLFLVCYFFLIAGTARVRRM